jgi:hypothetical protein
MPLLRVLAILDPSFEHRLCLLLTAAGAVHIFLKCVSSFLVTKDCLPDIDRFETSTLICVSRVLFSAHSDIFSSFASSFRTFG